MRRNVPEHVIEAKEVVEGFADSMSSMMEASHVSWAIMAAGVEYMQRHMGHEGTVEFLRNLAQTLEEPRRRLN